MVSHHIRTEKHDFELHWYQPETLFLFCLFVYKLRLLGCLGFLKHRFVLWLLQILTVQNLGKPTCFFLLLVFILKCHSDLFWCINDDVIGVTCKHCPAPYMCNNKGLEKQNDSKKKKVLCLSSSSAQVCHTQTQTTLQIMTFSIWRQILCQPLRVHYYKWYITSQSRIKLRL